jgi:hypothetical protein
VLASILVSTVAFFVASYFIKRWMDDNDIPKGMTRNVTVFALALAIAYGASWVVDHLIS